MAVLIVPSYPTRVKRVTDVDCICNWKLISPNNPNICKRCNGFINYRLGI